MAWTYSSGTSGDADVKARDTVRLYVGDTAAEDPLYQDEEIDIARTAYPDRPRVAAAVLLQALAAKFSRLADIQSGPQRVAQGSLAERYEKRAAELLKLEETETPGTVGSVIVAPYVAGLSRAEAELDRQDQDLTRPPFGVVGDGPSPLGDADVETMYAESVVP